MVSSTTPKEEEEAAPPKVACVRHPLGWCCFLPPLFLLVGGAVVPPFEWCCSLSSSSLAMPLSSLFPMLCSLPPFLWVVLFPPLRFDRPNDGDEVTLLES